MGGRIVRQTDMSIKGLILAEVMVRILSNEVTGIWRSQQERIQGRGRI